MGDEWLPARELTPEAVILICADAEWSAVRSIYPHAKLEFHPLGEWFPCTLDLPALQQESDQDVLIPKLVVAYMQTGWGKIAAAASTQYAIDRWAPKLLVNLGTCGGFAGLVELGEVILVERTIVYDILEQMGDAAAHIAHYSSELDLSWPPERLPMPVRRATMVSADRDLLPEDLPMLKARYGAVAGDWESGAIAWVAQRNRSRVLILRAVSDLVSERGDETYGNLATYEQAARGLMRKLIFKLPDWLAAAISKG